jgi:2-C-methyl-D-erythritol 4-phosphate cytidylyltransferase
MKVAIIVAAGSGKRFGGQLPKQFLILNDRPVLAHSIEVFAKSGAHVMVVLSDDMKGFWEEQCRQFQVQNHQIVTGGNERYDSVKNAIAVIPSGCKLVAIHDAARPAIDVEFIDRMWKAAEDKGSAIPYWPIADSLRMNQNGEWKIIDRNLVRSIQTPQCFQWNLIQDAYESEYLSIFTDDASVVELVKPGSLNFELGLAENIKITQSFDMDVMKAILSNRKI